MDGTGFRPGTSGPVHALPTCDDEFMLDLPTTLSVSLDQAEGKVRGAARPLPYLVSSMFAGMYIGIAVVLMVCTAGPFLEAGSPATKLVSGAVFGVGLTLVVFAGSELVTSAMMLLTQAVVTRRVPWAKALGTLVFCFAGNLAGSMLFGGLVVASGILHSNGPAGAMVADMLASKATESGTELFVRGILCNILVCLAIWCSNRLQSEAGKAIAIFWCLLAFISSGFEHVVANMTTYSIGLFTGGGLTTWGDFGRNLLLVGLGNFVGAAVIVGLGYLVATGWFAERRDRPRAEVR